jgi:hypothetical protein
MVRPGQEAWKTRSWIDDGDLETYREGSSSEARKRARSDVYEKMAILRDLPDGITPSCGWPTRCYAVKLRVGIGAQLADHFSYVGVIGVVQHQVATGPDFGDGVLHAFCPDAPVH